MGAEDRKANCPDKTTHWFIVKKQKLMSFYEKVFESKKTEESLPVPAMPRQLPFITSNDLGGLIEPAFSGVGGVSGLSCVYRFCHHEKKSNDFQKWKEEASRQGAM